MRASIAIILGAILVAGGFLVWHFISTQEYIANNVRERSLFVQEANELKEQIEQERQAEDELIKKMRRDPASIGVIVNKKHPLKPISYVPSDLVTDNGASLRKEVIADFNRMFRQAEADGQPFYVTSSYRSYETQVLTYNHWVNASGQKEADSYSARPGFSEHQTGLVIDVAADGCALNCFGRTEQYGWFKENASRFGFIQRYHEGEEHLTGYGAEEWHYRYVGPEVASDMKTKGIKSLEEYWDYPGGTYDN